MEPHVTDGRGVVLGKIKGFSFSYICTYVMYVLRTLVLRWDGDGNMGMGMVGWGKGKKYQKRKEKGKGEYQ